MMVYRQQVETVSLDELPPGEVEAAVADALCPDEDREHPLLTALRRASLGLGPVPAGIPAKLTVSVPEGFAYYALYPDAYRDAARKFCEECRPAAVVVIGVRGIGASLSAEVARELMARGCEVHSWTVRPRGHPFDRRLRIAGELDERWRTLSGAHFAVVDEGPGLSGTSFACVAEHLAGLGIPDSRVALFPSWEPDGAAFVSERARRRWALHRKYTGTTRAFDRFAGDRELSAGAWRPLVYRRGRLYPPVHPQHERRKYLRGGVLFKFAGLGRFGRRVHERARRLAEAGFGPPVEGLDDGFMAMRFLPGRAAPTAETIARYLAFIRREFTVPGDPEPLDEMIRVNVEEGLGASVRLHTPAATPVCLDARMLRHEWAGNLKTDGAEHHQDHFYPGAQDIAWDLAAAQIECGVDPVPHYERLTGDRAAARLPYYRVAWLAFRLGYASLAGGVDGGRWARERKRYTELLRRELWTSAP